MSLILIKPDDRPDLQKRSPRFRFLCYLGIHRTIYRTFLGSEGLDVIRVQDCVRLQGQPTYTVNRELASSRIYTFKCCVVRGCNLYLCKGLDLAAKNNDDHDFSDVPYIPVSFAMELKRRYGKYD